MQNGYKTDVKKVSESLESHEQISKSDMPALFPIDADEKRNWAQIAGTSSLDLEGELELVVTAVVFDRQNKTRQARTDLLRDVEKIMLNDTALLALVLFVEPMGVVTDKGDDS